MLRNPVSTFLSWLCASLVIFPLAALVIESIAGNDDALADIPTSVLLTYISNSLAVTLLAVAFSLLFAIAPAWWCSRYQFRGRVLLMVLMMLPLSIPAYVNGYILTEWLDYAGPIQTTLRQWFGWQSPQEYWAFNIRNIWGAGVVLGLALYPYVFLMTYHAFRKLPENVIAAAATLGGSPRRTFWQVQLPLARPAIAVGCTLVAMEALADFGTVQLFAVSTLTTAVYDTWLVYGSLASAAKIATLTLVFVLVIVGLERYSRRRQQFFSSKNVQAYPKRAPVSVKKQGLIWGYALSVFGLGFALPVLQLVAYLMDYWEQNTVSQQWLHLQQTLILAAVAGSLTVLIAMVVNFYCRIQPTRLPEWLRNVSSLGYAVPGTVLALAVLIPLTFADKWLNMWWLQLGGERLGLILSGSVFALILAYCIRFSAIAIGQVNAAYQQMPVNLDDAAYVLKSSSWRLWTAIHLPILRPALFSALVLVFIECVKELPASLLLRPFDFETLSTFVYQHASDEQLEYGAMSALMIVILSLIPVIFITRKLESK